MVLRDSSGTNELEKCVHRIDDRTNLHREKPIHPLENWQNESFSRLYLNERQNSVSKESIDVTYSSLMMSGNGGRVNFDSNG